NKSVWDRLPCRVRNLNVIRSYGAWLHRLICLASTRQQFFGTFFLRNRPALELMRRLAGQKPHGMTLRITVLGCSIGAEVYSILWTLRSARPDLKLLLAAVDISNDIVSFAEKGIYTGDTSQWVGASIFERLTKAEMAEMFDWEGDRAKVKPWLKEGITWHVHDVTDPEFIRVLGPQDIVVANNFLCHMPRADAERCLSKISQAVIPGGYLFVSGVDLDVRTKTALELGWEPVPELMPEIHDGDRSVRADWPWEWWGLEPLNRKRCDWQIRYAAAFRIASPKHL
ncbi:MAG: methyltransferase domain-containing protein, partial [Verrucomicrobia bacterium]|nr:methyltransferase domain-containing protein [Verrucomicrobiota bacterium]